VVVAASVDVGGCSSLISGDGEMSPTGTAIGGGWVGVGGGGSVRLTTASARCCA
jgi:hypothetical protein